MRIIIATGEPESEEHFSRKVRLAIVADGMGEEGGQIASHLAVDAARDISQAPLLENTMPAHSPRRKVPLVSKPSPPLTRRWRPGIGGSVPYSGCYAS